ncbi:MAG TPA: histidine kinase [Solirubrobacteraceae bacterium]|jgi:signal transduction histidine kinase
MARSLTSWFTTANRFVSNDGRAPSEAIFLRGLGLAYLVVFLISSGTTKPHPGLHGRGLVVLVATIAFVAAALATQPRAELGESRRLALLAVVTVSSAVLAVVQPNGIWQAGAYFIGVVAAIRLERRTGLIALGVSLAVLVGVSALAGRGGGAISVVLGAVPWFLVMRLMRDARERHAELLASQAAEARAAAAAERGRVAREMHDVLAHSLSALALQLESTRLLARERGVDDEVTRGLDQAHHLAAGGLEEARRAIGAARGDELPGPERLGALAEAFGEQSGLPVSVEIRGDPRELAPDERLALYRTAQEALTNVRRHAAAERVRVQLEYGSQSTVLVVEDHAPDSVPPPVGLGLGGNGYGLTGMRERAELLGGELLAEPTSDGFRVELRLPA